MRKKTFLAIIALIVLSGFVVLGSSPGLVGKILESAQNNPITKAFSSLTQNTKAEIKKDNPKPVSTVQDADIQEIPQTVLWYMVFRMNETIEKEQQKLIEQGKNGEPWGDYFKRQAKLSDEQATTLREKSVAYLEEIKPIDEKAKEIIEKGRATFLNGKNAGKTEIPKPPIELKELQDEKDKVTLQYRDAFREAIGEDAFSQFGGFLNDKFSKGIVSGKLELPTQEFAPQGWYIQSRII